MSNNILEIIKDFDFNIEIPLNEIPNIELYMDQVISLFDTNLSELKRNNEDNILTKTMINNYSKDKLLMPSVKKKYSKDHIILMIMIYHLKQSLSISDIKKLVTPLVENYNIDKQDLNLEQVYTLYLEYSKFSVTDTELILEDRLKEIYTLINDNSNKDYIYKLLSTLIICKFSTIYKRMAEKLIDSM